MKTLIDIDESVLEQAMRYSETRTKKEIVNTALADFVRKYEAQKYLEDLRAGLASDLDDVHIVAQAQR